MARLTAENIRELARRAALRARAHAARKRRAWQPVAQSLRLHRPQPGRLDRAGFDPFSTTRRR